MSGGALAAGELVRLATPRESLLLAQETANWTEMQSWFEANTGGGSQFNTYNQQLVPHFNNIYNKTYTPTDISDAGDVAGALADYFSQTGNPTLDWCAQSSILANVPSPGSASSVLFTEPTSTDVGDVYNQAQSYGYDITYDQLAALASIPNLSTWPTNNPFYPLCTNYCSSYLTQLSKGFFLAGGYLQTHDSFEKSLSCQDLIEGREAIVAVGLELAGLFAFATLAPALALAALDLELLLFLLYELASLDAELLQC